MSHIAFASPTHNLLCGITSISVSKWAFLHYCEIIFLADMNERTIRIVSEIISITENITITSPYFKFVLYDLGPIEITRQPT